jgi:hypothetical protein
MSRLFLSRNIEGGNGRAGLVPGAAGEPWERSTLRDGTKHSEVGTPLPVGR